MPSTVTVTSDTANLVSATGVISGNVGLSDNTNIPVSGTLTKGATKATNVGTSNGWTLNATWNSDNTVTGKAVSGSNSIDDVTISVDHPGRSRHRTKSKTSARTSSRPASRAKPKTKAKTKAKAKAGSRTKVKKKARARRRS